MRVVFNLRWKSITCDGDLVNLSFWIQRVKVVSSGSAKRKRVVDAELRERDELEVSSIFWGNKG